MATDLIRLLAGGVDLRAALERLRTSRARGALAAIDGGQPLAEAARHLVLEEQRVLACGEACGSLRAAARAWWRHGQGSSWVLRGAGITLLYPGAMALVLTVALFPARRGGPVPEFGLDHFPLREIPAWPAALAMAVVVLVGLYWGLFAIMAWRTDRAAAVAEAIAMRIPWLGRIYRDAVRGAWSGAAAELRSGGVAAGEAVAGAGSLLHSPLARAEAAAIQAALARGEPWTDAIDRRGRRGLARGPLAAAALASAGALGAVEEGARRRLHAELAALRALVHLGGVATIAALIVGHAGLWSGT